MHDLTLTKAQMRTMKGYLAEKGIFFPNTTALIEARAQLRPVILVEFVGDGASVDYTALVKSTSSSLIGMIQSKDPEAQPIDPSKPVVVVYKDGGDTAGSQTVWKSISMKDVSDHLFQFSVVPLRVEQSGTVVWKNPSPNSAKSCRPVYLLRASENEQRVKYLGPPNTDSLRVQLMSHTVELFCDTDTFTVNHVIHSSMKDPKLKKTWSGLGGADCILCELRREDWREPVKVAAGFPTTCLAADTHTV